MTDNYSFCIAPLDVLKIRLQLQSHSLSDALSTPHQPKRFPPSTISTFKNILRHEGITVRMAWLRRRIQLNRCRPFGKEMSPPSFSM